MNYNNICIFYGIWVACTIYLSLIKIKNIEITKRQKFYLLFHIPITASIMIIINWFYTINLFVNSIIFFFMIPIIGYINLRIIQMID